MGGFFLGMNLPNIYINDYKSTSCTVIDQYPLESRIVAYDCNCNSYGYCQTCYRTEYLASIELTVNLPTGAQNMAVCDKDECIKAWSTFQKRQLEFLEAHPIGSSHTCWYDPEFSVAPRPVTEYTYDKAAKQRDLGKTLGFALGFTFLVIALACIVLAVLIHMRIIFD